MTPITIYTTEFCAYCRRAKALLEEKGAKYTEIDVTHDSDERKRMTARASGRRTVPQIFIGDRHVGGSEDLHALNVRGQLDALLAGT